jgi:hypothetical protein
MSEKMHGTADVVEISYGLVEATPTETLVAELRSKDVFYGNNTLADVFERCVKAADLLTTQSALIETLTRERDEARLQRDDWNAAAMVLHDEMRKERDEAISQAADANSQWAFWATMASEQKGRAEAAEAALADARAKALEDVITGINAVENPGGDRAMQAYYEGWKAAGDLVTALKSALP